MNRAEPLRIVAVASMKRGLEPFIHRELKHFRQLGHEIALVPTKIGPGLYQPENDWTVLRPSVLGFLAGHAAQLAAKPRLYLRLLAEAWRYGVLTEFLLAGAHARELGEQDVVYATFADRKLFVAYFLKRLLGLPLAVNIHAYEIYANPNTRFFRRALAACDQVSTVTEYNREQLAERHGIDPATVRVTRIPVDLQTYKPRSTFVVLIVGFFSARKGHADLFEAVRRLADPDMEVWVVGAAGSEEYCDVPALAEEKGLTGQVAFFGALRGSALEALYRRADVFCLPSRTTSEGVKEGFPTVIAEAMAFGKPVVSTLHSEIPRLLDELLVEEGDVEGLAEALRRLRDDASLRERLGNENRLKAERLFGLTNVERTAAGLAQIAKRGQGTSPTAVIGELKGRPG